MNSDPTPFPPENQSQPQHWTWGVWPRRMGAPWVILSGRIQDVGSMSMLHRFSNTCSEWTSQFYHVSNNYRQLEIPISPPPFYGYRQPPCPASLLQVEPISEQPGGRWNLTNSRRVAAIDLWFFGCRTSWISHRMTRTVKTLNRFLHGEGFHPSQATRISKKWAYLCQAAGEVTYQCLQCTHIKYNMIQYHTIHMWKNVCLRVYMYVYVSTCTSTCQHVCLRVCMYVYIHNIRYTHIIYYILYMHRITLDR